MALFINKYKVRTPKYNIFPHITQNKLSFDIGRNIPVKFVELFPGEEIDLSVSQVTRFMPMTAPVFHDVDLQFIPFFVPYRLLSDFGFDASSFFNDATKDSERPPMPVIDMGEVFNGALQ